jgi:hypothetical protein
MDQPAKNKGLWIFLGVTAAILLVLSLSYAIASKQANKRLERVYGELRAAKLPMTIEEIVPPEVDDRENAAIAYASIVAYLKAETVDGANLFDASGAVAAVARAKAEPEEVSKSRDLLALPVIQRAIADLETAAVMPAFRQDLDYSQGINMETPHAADRIRLTELLAASAVLVAPDQPALAWKQLEAAFLMAGQGSDEPILIGQMIRCAQAKVAYLGMTQVAAVAPPTAAQAIAIDAAMVPLDELETFSLAISGERLLLGEQSFNMFASGHAALLSGGSSLPHVILRSSPTFTIDRAAYLEIMLEYHRIATTPFAPSDLTVADHLFDELPKYCIVTGLIAPALGPAKLRYVESQARVRLTRTGLALIRHKAGNGAFPDTLNALGNMAELTDPFSGSALIYHRADSGFVLYSVGRNQIDDDANAEDDVVWRFAPPK